MATTFAQDVLQGLLSQPKSLPSKYFYDARGDALFQQIMALEEYYLTRCEFEILSERAAELLALCAPQQQPFDLIELGAGDGLKTKVLLRHFLQAGAAFRYLPLDISANAVEQLVCSVQTEFPELHVKGLQDDYFHGLDQLQTESSTRKVLLFLGSSIGNLSDQEATGFLAELGRHLAPDDLLLIGFDLRKDPAQVLAAYHDAQGVTAAFNLNLLSRINQELEADFDLSGFTHFPLYDPVKGEARSYLISTRSQTVTFPHHETTVHFEPWEAVHTEISRKYTLEGVEAFAAETGFEIVQHLRDRKGCFLDSVWRKK